MLRLLASALVTLFAVDSLVTHFRNTTFLTSTGLQDAITTPQAGDKVANVSRHGGHMAGISPAHQRLHDFVTTQRSDSFTVTSWTSADEEMSHYSIERDVVEIPSQSVLFLSITRDEKSWGRNPSESARDIYSFLDFVTNTTLSPSAASVAILTSSSTEFERYKQILTPVQDGKQNKGYYDYAFHRVTIVLHTADTRAPVSQRHIPGELPSELHNESASRGDRHSIPQHERRAILAKLRNYLQSVALAHESHLLWLDSDVYKFSSNLMVEYMMRRTTTTNDQEVGILTARCRMGEPEKTDAWLAEHPEFHLPPPPKDGEKEDEKRGVEGGAYEIIAHKLHAQGQYDLNAWRGRRVGPNNIEQESLWKDLSSWEPHPADGKTDILDKAIDKSDNDDLIRLDSVGGTILMFRADLVRMGLNFPAGYVVGMTFEHGEGYDGIETEGVCVLSRSFSRDGQSMCYSLGGDWSVWHTVF